MTFSPSPDHLKAQLASAEHLLREAERVLDHAAFVATNQEDAEIFRRTRDAIRLHIAEFAA